jgi:hypothetical protein
MLPAPEMTVILTSPVIALQVAVHALRNREDGQTKTEFAIVLGLLVITIIVALYFAGNASHARQPLFSDAPSNVSDAPGP